MLILELLKSVFLGVVEGITEWLPISSTGHLILVDEFLHLNVSTEFMDMYRYVIQLGAIMAVLILYFHKLNPFSPKKDAVEKKSTWRLWGMVAIGCIPAAVIGLLFDDLVNELAPKLEACDGLVVGSPVYYASANATLVALLTRLFYSTPFDKTMKVGAAVAAARRGGLSSTFDELNKFFTISGMPVASSQYWNSIHGRLPGEAAQDTEGLQTMRTLARNMAFLVKSIALGREKYGLPEREEPLRTHFIR